MRKLLIALQIVALCSVLSVAVETVTIPKENYDNIRHLVSSMSLRVEARKLSGYSLVDVGDILADLRKQLDITWDYCRPMNADEEISVLKGEISILKMRLNILEGKKGKK